MADSRFLKRAGPFSASELAQLAGCDLAGPDDAATRQLEDVAALDQAGPGQISFLDNIRYKDQFTASKATALIARPEMQEVAPPGAVLLLSKQPYKAYALIARHFYPETKPEAALEPSAIIAPDAALGEGCTVAAGAVIGAGAKLGAACWIEENAVIGPGVVLGDGCRVGAGASVSHALIGNNVRLYPGARIGQDGFGFAIDPSGYVKVPQLGRVLIGDGVEIGANSTIDRGAGPDTEIGAGSWIDNLVQIGHNVKTGKGCVIVAQAGISGSTTLGDYVMLGGQAGLTGHLKVGSGARIGAQAGVMRDVEPGSELIGSPALPAKLFMRQIAILNKLVKGRGKKP